MNETECAKVESTVVESSSLVCLTRGKGSSLYQNIKGGYELHTSCEYKYNNKWDCLASECQQAPVQDMLDDVIDLCACDCTPQPVRTLPRLYESHLGRVVHRGILELEVVYVVDAQWRRQV